MATRQMSEITGVSSTPKLGPSRRRTGVKVMLDASGSFKIPFQRGKPAAEVFLNRVRLHPILNRTIDLNNSVMSGIVKSTGFLSAEKAHFPELLVGGWSPQAAWLAHAQREIEAYHTAEEPEGIIVIIVGDFVPSAKGRNREEMDAELAVQVDSFRRMQNDLKNVVVYPVPMVVDQDSDEVNWSVARRVSLSKVPTDATTAFEEVFNAIFEGVRIAGNDFSALKRVASLDMEELAKEQEVPGKPQA